MSETIAAVSSPHGKGGIAVIRISGEEAKLIASRMFVPASEKSIDEYPPRTAVYGYIKDPVSGKTTDSGILVLFTAPYSFTGEDTAEVSCHGGVYVTAMTLDAALKAGARQAEAGEFTKRAFLNGKLSLTGAEALADLLDAKSESSVMLSGANMRGRLSEKLHTVSDDLKELVISLSAYIDYPDEDLEEIPDNELKSRMDNLISGCDALIDSYKTGAAVTEGVPSVIIGKPNVGKSSLFNLMAGEDRAIVTDIPGTTRDMLEIPVKAGKIILRLCDAAGIRQKTTDSIEKKGMERVWRFIDEKKPLIFALFDSSSPLDGDDKAIIERLKAVSAEDKRVIPVLTKCDLPCMGEKTQEAISSVFGNPEHISAFDQTSVTKLTERAERLFTDVGFDESDGGIITNIRQKNVIADVRGLIAEAGVALDAGQKDMTGIFLEKALVSLSGVDGSGVSADIINGIFTRFCVGK